MPLVSVSSKGQLVIPKGIREGLHIKPGQKVLLRLARGHAELTPVPENPVDAFCGAFGDGPSLTAALLKERKEDLRREEKASARHIRSSGILEKGK